MSGVTRSISPSELVGRDEGVRPLGAEFGPYRKHGPKKWGERRYCTAACAGRDGGDKIRLPDEQRKPTYRNGYRMRWCSRRGRLSTNTVRSWKPT